MVLLRKKSVKILFKKSVKNLPLMILDDFISIFE